MSRENHRRPRNHRRGLGLAELSGEPPSTPVFEVVLQGVEKTRAMRVWGLCVALQSPDLGANGG